MNDEQAGEALAAALELAVTVRDEIGPAVTDAARKLLAVAGDPVAAVTLTAALIPVDRPVDRWWQEPPTLHARRVDVAALTGASQADARQLAPCGTHAAFNRHRDHDEEPDMACRLAERTYQRERMRARRSSGRVS